MTQKVSVSRTGHNRSKPSRKERDEAYSSGAGRKAEEQEVETVSCPSSAESKASLSRAPIGTDLETKAAESFH